MNKEPVFTWDSEEGLTTCIIYNDNNKPFVGVAACHPEDFDMMSEKTGSEIAFRRARIAAAKYERDIIKTKLTSLLQYYYSIKHSSQFNEKSYENRMLQRQIRFLQDDLAIIKEVIANERQNVRNYIEEKDKFYIAVRKRRETIGK